MTVITGPLVRRSLFPAIPENTRGGMFYTIHPSREAAGETTDTSPDHRPSSSSPLWGEGGRRPEEVSSTLGVPHSAFQRSVQVQSAASRRKERSAAQPQPKTLPLLHRMEERAGERRRFGSLHCPSPRSSPHSFLPCGIGAVACVEAAGSIFHGASGERKKKSDFGDKDVLSLRTSSDRAVQYRLIRR